jgi:hypothetical protein
MKRFVITQHGVRDAAFKRSFVLEVSDNMTVEDIDALDEDHLEVLADEQCIEWSEPDVTDIQADHHHVECELGEADTHRLEVVKWSEETN